MEHKNIHIDLTFVVTIGALICFATVATSCIKESTKVNIEKEKTKQIALQLQIEQQKK